MQDQTGWSIQNSKELGSTTYFISLDSVFQGFGNMIEGYHGYWFLLIETFEV